MMISGNHDSAPRVNCFRKVLSGQNIYMVGQPPRTESEYIEKVTLNDAYGEMNFYLLPFVKPSMVKQVVGVDENGNNLSYNETLHRLIGREKLIQTREMYLSATSFIFLPVRMQRMWNVWIPRCVRSEISMKYQQTCWKI